jgi:hypothetical protein
VVLTSVPANAIVAGVPAKLLKVAAAAKTAEGIENLSETSLLDLEHCVTLVSSPVVNVANPVSLIHIVLQTFRVRPVIAVLRQSSLFGTTDTFVRVSDGVQRWISRENAREIVPTKTRLTAQVPSRLNQLRDRNLRPR